MRSQPARIRDIADWTKGEGPDWYTTPPKGTSYFEHRATFVQVLLEHTNRLIRKWNVDVGSDFSVLVGRNVFSIIETMLTYKPTHTFGGVIMGRWSINVDDSMDSETFTVKSSGHESYGRLIHAPKPGGLNALRA